MIELTVYNHLKTKLSEPIFLELPSNHAIPCVVIEKTGSSQYDHINNATFAVQSYGKTLYEAAELNERVKEAMNSLVEVNSIAKSSLNSDYQYTDTTTKHYRYQAVYDLIHY